MIGGALPVLLSLLLGLSLDIRLTTLPLLSSIGMLELKFSFIHL